ncbi:glycoside hydrolase family protein [Sphingobium ummariense]
MDFDSLAQATSASIPGGITYVRTAYYASVTVGGGATYARSTISGSGLGRFQSADGAWWEISEPFVTPQMFGAVANGNIANMAADTHGIQAAIDFSVAHKVPIFAPAGIYIIDGYKGDRPSWTAGEWAHGGLILRPGTALRGAGRGITIFRNGIANWRCILRIPSGNTSIRHLTVDGDRENYTPIPYADTVSSTGGSIRGEGIIYAGSDVGDNSIDVLDVEVMNTGHYGIGVANIRVTSGIIKNVYFRNTGGDCIDVKWFSSPNYDKNLIIDGVFADGCGYYFLGGGNSADNGSQAVVDIGGKTIVQNIHVSALDSDPTSSGNCGVRLRARVNDQNRLDARGSSVDGVFIKSIKADGAGSPAFQRIVGLQINCEQVSVSNIHVENCFNGIRINDSADGVPNAISLSNIRMINCRGENGEGTGLSSTSACRGINASNIHAVGCDTGIVLSGQLGNYTGLYIINNDVGIFLNDQRIGNNFICGIQYSGNTIDVSSSSTPGSSALINNGLSVYGQRKVWADIVSLADDSSWTNENRWLGGTRFFKTDTSSSAGEQLRFGAYSTGSSGASFDFAIHFPAAALPQFRFGSTSYRLSVPTVYEGTNRLWDSFSATKNDNSWLEEDAWIGGHRWLTADANASQPEVVRVGVRARAASGTTYAWAVQHYGTDVLRVSENRISLSVAAIGDYANDAAAAAGGIGIGDVYRTGSTLKVRVT